MSYQDTSPVARFLSLSQAREMMPLMDLANEGLRLHEKLSLQREDRRGEVFPNEAVGVLAWGIARDASTQYSADGLIAFAEFALSHPGLEGISDSKAACEFYRFATDSQPYANVHPAPSSSFVGGGNLPAAISGGGAYRLATGIARANLSSLTPEQQAGLPHFISLAHRDGKLAMECARTGVIQLFVSQEELRIQRRDMNLEREALDAASN